MRTKTLLLLSALFTSTIIVAQDEIATPTVDATAPTTEQTLSQAASVAEQAAEAPKEKNWKCTGIISLNASATGLWNWAAGGDNNLTGVAATNITLLYQKNNIAWETNLDAEYGMTYTTSLDYKPWRKSSDKLNFTTKFGWEFHKTWYLTVLGSFKSQFARGYEYGSNEYGNYMKPVSSILSPSYTDISVGIDWKPNEIFSIYISPIAGRISTCTTDYYNYNLPDSTGLVPMQNSVRAGYGMPVADETAAIPTYKPYLAELGLSAKAGVNYTRIENLKIISTVGVFTPYKKADKTIDPNTLRPKDNNRRFGNFDVDWDFAISYQFLKVLNVTLSTSLKYVNGVLIADKNGENPVERVQFKGNIGLGVGYSF